MRVSRGQSGDHHRAGASNDDRSVQTRNKTFTNAPLPTPILSQTSMALSSASEQAPADVTGPEVHTSLVATLRNQCPTCAAAMAPDQRYCVECGERRGAPRVAALDGSSSRPPAEEPVFRAAPPRARGMSVNTTLVAVIGTLLLALGVGVLIGRSGASTSIKAPPAQVVTVEGSGTPGAASNTATQPAITPTATPTGKATGTTGKAAAKSSTKPASTTATPKAVKVGTPGKGRGYQHGHFTGNFFGEEG